MPTPNKTYKSFKDFNADQYDEYIAKEQYNQAADYMEEFLPNDPGKINDYIFQIYQLRQKAYETEQLYNGIDEDTKNKIRFANKVFTPEGLKDESNDYVERYINAKNQIGTSITKSFFTGHTMQYRTIRRNKDYGDYIDIKFEAPSKFSFRNGITDRNVYNENANNIDTFCKQNGYTLDGLKQQGITPIKQDDESIVLRIKQDNSNFNKFIYDVYNTQKTVKGFFTGWFDEDIKISRVDKGGISEFVPITDDPYAVDFYNMIDRALNTKLSRKEEVHNEVQTYTTTLGSYISDKMQMLDDFYSKGYYTDAQYKERRDWALKEHKNLIKNIDTNLPMYSSYYNEDGVMTELDAKKKNSLLKYMQNANPEDITLQSMIANGEIGVYVTIKGKNDSPKAGTFPVYSSDDAEELRGQQAIRFFIPGALHEKAQASIMQNTNTRSVLEYNNLTKYNKDYTFVDDTKLKNIDGVLHYNGKALTEHEATELINKDMIVRDSRIALYQRNVNSKGQIINTDKYDKEVWLTAIKAASELYPNVSLTDDDNNSLISNDGINIQKLINMKSSTNSALKPEVEDRLLWDISKKLNTIYEIYDKILGVYKP
jgi:hypothetical protein